MHIEWFGEELLSNLDFYPTSGKCKKCCIKRATMRRIGKNQPQLPEVKVEDDINTISINKVNISNIQYIRWLPEDMELLQKNFSKNVIKD